MSKPSHSFAMTNPRDCLKSKSRAECKALVTAQADTAQQAGDSVDIEQCIQTPTPQCEAVLRRAVEAQHAALQGAEK
jgi:hypothetical protein